jgi:hypothetical protein
VATEVGQQQSLSEPGELRKLPCNNTVYSELILGGKLGARREDETAGQTAEFFADL